MPSKKHQSTIESNSAFMVKMEDLVKEIIIQNNIPYYRIESRMDHHAGQEGNSYMPVVRVITYFEDSVSKISEIICSEFDVVNERSKDKKKIRLDSFSYKHVQFMASLKSARQELIEYRRSGNQKFEIQVCSMLQDAWAGIERELGYDNATFPDEMKRDFYRVGALLEMADLEFLKIRSQLSSRYGWVEQDLDMRVDDTDDDEEETTVPAAQFIPQPIAPTPAPKPEPQPVQQVINNYIPEVVAAPQQPQPQYIPQPQIPVQQAAPMQPVYVPVQVQPVPVQQPMNIPQVQYVQPQAQQYMPQPATVPQQPMYQQAPVMMQASEAYIQQPVQPAPVQPAPVQQAYVPQPAPVVIPVQNIAMQVVEEIKAVPLPEPVNNIVNNVAPQPVYTNGATEQKVPEVVNVMPLNIPVTPVVETVNHHVPPPFIDFSAKAAESLQQAASHPAPAATPAEDESIPFYEREAKPVVKSNVLDENAQMTDATLKQYVANSKLVKEVDSEVARRAGASLNSEVDIEGDVERLKYLKVYSLKQLHERISDNKNDIIAFAEKWIGKDNGGSFDSGICLFYLEYLLVGKKNDPAFAVEYVLKFISDNDYSARFIIPTYNSISKPDQPIASHLTLK